MDSGGRLRKKNVFCYEQAVLEYHPVSHDRPYGSCASAPLHTPSLPPRHGHYSQLPAPLHLAGTWPDPSPLRGTAPGKWSTSARGERTRCARGRERIIPDPLPPAGAPPSHPIASTSCPSTDSTRSSDVLSRGISSSFPLLDHLLYPRPTPPWQCHPIKLSDKLSLKQALLDSGDCQKGTPGHRGVKKPHRRPHAQHPRR